MRVSVCRMQSAVAIDYKLYTWSKDLLITILKTLLLVIPTSCPRLAWTQPPIESKVRSIRSILTQEELFRIAFQGLA
jgi:hypothetical protein